MNDANLNRRNPSTPRPSRSLGSQGKYTHDHRASLKKPRLLLPRDPPPPCSARMHPLAVHQEFLVGAPFRFRNRPYPEALYLCIPGGILCKVGCITATALHAPSPLLPSSPFSSSRTLLRLPRPLRRQLLSRHVSRGVRVQDYIAVPSFGERLSASRSFYGHLTSQPDHHGNQSCLVLSCVVPSRF